MCASSDATLFWLIRESVYYVRATAECTCRSDSDSISLPEIPANVHQFIGPKQDQLLSFTQDDLSIVITVDGPRITSQNLRFKFCIDGHRDLIRALPVLKTLSSILIGQSGKRRPLRTSSRARFRDALVAIDGLRTGATLRDTAIVLYGHKRVSEDWSAASRWMKDHIRRDRDRGLRLMEGEYRNLLS